ncbi:related to export control protein CHS7 [Ramularia collo-cygni]|uniref:Related to export control protein CHS7 n=1 Tax=Ramularia collo-cygni TaxID=112498 RepID=A0A2D3V596_9PEZI|nr:related to export control protein CHS7 [Ramularia collo-cygni]CZT18716.1 related to export control protein CHS7 [Ramularia collo-cygni]
MSRYGKWDDFCRDSGSGYATIPVCNLFEQARARGGSAPYFDGCELEGISLGGDRHLANLGSILIAGIAILASFFLLWKSERKKAAVGRREMQIFLIGYIIIEICEIFTVGGFPLNGAVRRVFSAVHIAAVVATLWILMMNGAVGYQLIDDGTPLSIALIFGSAAALFVGTGYIALDTAFSWTGYFDDTLPAPNQAYALYTLYQLVPLVFLVVYFILESVLVLKVLGEVRPMYFLVGAAVLFAIGQIFQYVISVHICNGTNGAINGGLFETLFTLLAVITIWFFWSSITEDDWPMPPSTGSTYT